MPSFALNATNGETVTDRYFSDAKFSLIVFTCNHCPFVKGSEAMLFETIKEFQPRGLKAVLISSNDAVQYPEDSFDKMKEKAKSASIPCPYLYDESQAIAREFDAECTPELYLFDAQQRLIFHGTINNSPRSPQEANTNFLKVALSQAFEGREPSPSFVHPIGCSIKWKAI